ncbi:MAG: YajQ family cyclic di-GMP-binding protein [Omnitrophica bacterium RIFCSPLOWO2_01_FULL_50_24]|nr:MAG: YajQ family cyclic di-GMP-binding protein [Omnitrophica bacterium RIFCSPLOWO2_01_FULL_50_24]
MPQESSFDIASSVDLQELDNAVNQVVKEMQTRYDFKGSKSELTFDRKEKAISILADNDLRLKSIIDMLFAKCAKRGVPLKAIKFGAVERALDQMVRQSGSVVQGIPQEEAKEIVKRIKALKLKVQSTIQGDSVRVSGKSKDDLQTVIHTLRAANFSVALQFVNYR